MFVHTATELVVAQMPNPGGPLAPPGSDKALMMLRWLLWGVFAVLFAGFAYCAGKIGTEHSRGMGGGEAMAGLWKPAVGMLIASNIVGIAAALVTFK